MPLQVRIPVALAALQNFIREHEDKPEPEPEPEPENNDEFHAIGGRVDGDDDGDEFHTIGGRVDDEAEENSGFDEPDERRDEIAAAMWTQYLQEHVRRGIPIPV